LNQDSKEVLINRAVKTQRGLNRVIEDEADAND